MPIYNRVGKEGSGETPPPPHGHDARRKINGKFLDSPRRYQLVNIYTLLLFIDKKLSIFKNFPSAVPIYFIEFKNGSIPATL